MLNITREELQQMISETVQKELEHKIKELSIFIEDDPDNDDPRTLSEIQDSIERHRITPQPGTPTSLEMLREDRDR